ncbi:MAG: PDZ domain-containing protein [Gemmatimonadales bacterium]|nr:PDZ domain-containing protein [Gemmatimonadales bacterium]
MTTTFRRSRLAALAALTLLTLAPAVAGAQVTVRRLTEQQQPVRIIINGKEVTAENLGELLYSRRARLGVTVDMRAQPNDSVGATLEAVTPGGPAFKAGIQSGDIIIKLDGTSVTAGPRPADADAEQSIPALRLVEIASRLAPDVTVAVEFKRGNQRRTVSLVTGNEPIALGDLLEGERRMIFSRPDDERRVLVERMPGEALPFGFRETMPGGTFEFRTRARFADLELAPINPELGSYFGTSEGVLVVRVGEGSSLGLKGGDVLLAIDGRRVSTPASAMRILSSYEAGETLKLEIQRNRQKQTLTATLSNRE